MIFLYAFALFLLLFPPEFKVIPFVFLAVLAAAVFCRAVLKKRHTTAKDLLRAPFLLILSSLVIDVRIAQAFYARWDQSVIAARVSALIGVKAQWLVAAGAVVLALLSFFAVLSFLFSVYHAIDERKRFHRESPNRFLTSSVSRAPEAAIVATVYTALFYASQSMLILWSTTDNYRISQVLNGVYSDENYCIFLHPFISFIVKGMSRILPHADCFVLLTEILLLIGVWCLTYLLVTSLKRINAFIVFVLICLFNLDLNILHSAFTVTATFLTGIGFICLYSWIRRRAALPFGIVGAVLMLFGFMWRYDAFIMTLPFIGLAVVSDVVIGTTKKEMDRKALVRLIASAALVAFLCTGARIYVRYYNSGGRYADGITYNTYRSDMCDYRSDDCSDIVDELRAAGYSENDYAMARNLILLDTERIDTEFLRGLSEISEKTSTEKIASLGSGINALCDRFSMNAPFYYFNAVALLFVLYLDFTSKAHLIRKLEIVFAILGAALMLLYVAYLGHIPVYVVKSIVCGVWIVSASVFTVEKAKLGEHSVVKQIAFLCALLFATYTPALFDNYDITTKSITETSLTARDYDYFDSAELDKIDSSDDAIFIWSVFERNALVYRNARLSSKMENRDFLSHNLLDGEWIYGQPYFEDFLEESGIENPIRALTDKRATYYIAPEDRCEIVLTYIREHYCKSVDAEQVGTVYGRPVWQFIKHKP